MIEYSGKRVSTARDAVTGKLLDSKSLSSKKADAAAIIIWDGNSNLCAELLDGAVGIVLPEFLTPEQRHFAAQLAEFCHLPAIYLSCPLLPASAPSHCDVAILSPVEGKLFVNPDVETVRSFLCSLPHGIKKKLSVLSTAEPAPEGCDGLVIGKELERFTDEESAYEYLCEIADKHTGIKLVASIPFGENTEVFSSRVKALYRAGVWGRFSLLCTGIKTPERALDCISLIHSAFCLLDSENREFNGFIPKGICIDTPILLLDPPRARSLDFFCLDVSSLSESFSGGCSRDPRLIEKYLLESKKKVSPADIALKLEGSVPPDFLERIAPKEIYASVLLSSEILGWI